MITKHLENTLLARPLLLDVFGIGSAVSGAAGAAASITSTHSTNQANKEIAKETNETQLKIHEDDRKFNAEEAEKSREFNAEEAEKARQFNAEEAQKSREWNSESEVMKRRADAGLNTAVTGESGTTGGSSASATGPAASSSQASAPSSPLLVTPQMQPLPIGEAVTNYIDTLLNVAKTRTDILGGKAQAKRDLAQADYTAEQAEHQRIINEWTPQTCRATFDNLVSKTNLNKADIDLKNANLEALKTQMDNYFIQGVATYYDMVVSIQDVNQRANFFLANFPLEYERLHQDAKKFEAEWKQRGFDLSYKWGSHKKNVNGWNVNISANAHRGRSGDSSTSEIESNGAGTRVTDSDGDVVSNTSQAKKLVEEASKYLGGFGFNAGGSYDYHNETKNYFRNEDAYNIFVEMQGCINIAQSPSYSKAQQDQALRRLNNLTLSAEAYKFFIMNMGKVKRFPQQVQQDFEDQQLSDEY